MNHSYFLPNTQGAPSVMEAFEFPSETFAQMEQLAEGSDYPLEAYEFVAREVTRLMWHRGSLPEVYRGVSDEALCWKLHDRALLEFKNRAIQQLAKWNVHETKDFGAIVYGLVSIGFLGKEKGDSERNFENIFDFNEEFEELHFERMPLFPVRWRVSTLLVATTVAAIGCAGFSKHGLDGALGTLLSSWLVLLGMASIYMGVSNRSKDWLLAVAAGVIFTSLGILSFILIAS